jgi:hypothetical protein
MRPFIIIVMSITRVWPVKEHYQTTSDMIQFTMDTVTKNCRSVMADRKKSVSKWFQELKENDVLRMVKGVRNIFRIEFIGLVNGNYNGINIFGLSNWGNGNTMERLGEKQFLEEIKDIIYEHGKIESTVRH